MSSRPTSLQPGPATPPKATSPIRSQVDVSVAKREPHVCGARDQSGGQSVASESNRRRLSPRVDSGSVPAFPHPGGGGHTASSLAANSSKPPQLGSAHSGPDTGASHAVTPTPRLRRIVDEAMYADALRTTAEHGPSKSGGEGKTKKGKRSFYDAVDLVKSFLDAL